MFTSYFHAMNSRQEKNGLKQKTIKKCIREVERWSGMSATETTYFGPDMTVDWLDPPSTSFGSAWYFNKFQPQNDVDEHIQRERDVEGKKMK